MSQRPAQQNNSSAILGAILCLVLLFGACNILDDDAEDAAVGPDTSAQDKAPRSTPPAPVAEGTTTVSRVIDGDSFETSLGIIRVLGMDAPETGVYPDEPMECWGPESAAWATNVLSSQTVTLVRDPIIKYENDPYDRPLRSVILADGRDFATLAVKTGNAESDSSHPGTAREHLSEVWLAAMQGRLSMHGDPCNPLPAPVDSTPADTDYDVDVDANAPDVDFDKPRICNRKWWC